MSKKSEISDVVDSLLKFVVFGGVLTAGIVAPNSIQVLEKPAEKFFKKIDVRKKERELKRLVGYMREKDLLKGDYQYGLQITEKGRKRLAKSEVDNLVIKKPKKWDGRWRVVLYDIPEKQKPGRNALTRKVKEIGFYQLQKSVWLHPYPCRNEIEAIFSLYRVDQYVTYIETSFIDKQDVLKKYFKLK